MTESQIMRVERSTTADRNRAVYKYTTRSGTILVTKGPNLVVWKKFPAGKIAIYVEYRVDPLSSNYILGKVVEDQPW